MVINRGALFVGSIGGVSFVSTDQAATCNCKLAILRPRKIKPEFIAIYLKTKFGQSQIQRFTRGAVQMGLILEDMDQLLVPDFSDEFEKVIVQVVQAVKFCLKKSEYTYYQAEDLLLSELGLKDWQPTEENIAVKSFSASFGTSRRLDAEYYQPKYEKLYLAIETAARQKQWVVKE